MDIWNVFLQVVPGSQLSLKEWGVVVNLEWFRFEIDTALSRNDNFRYLQHTVTFNGFDSQDIISVTVLQYLKKQHKKLVN